MYLFDGTAIILNVRAEAREKKYEYPRILRNAVIFTLSLFVTFSTICYYVYREKSEPIFVMSLVPINTLVFVILGCVCTNALTSYPVQMLAAFMIIEKFEIFGLVEEEGKTYSKA